MKTHHFPFHSKACWLTAWFVFVWAVALSQPTPKTDRKLEALLRQLCEPFEGTAGVYVYHLRTGKAAGYHADTIFPTASIVKVPILVGLFDKIEKGELQYHQPLVYRDSIRYGGSGLMQFYKDSTNTDLRTLAALMITYSDNTTALWCQALAGGGEAINALLARMGFQYTRVNSRTPGREQDRERFGWGQTTPREMAWLLTGIRRGEVISPAASDRMYRLLGNIFYDDYALSQLPPWVKTASKQGMVNDSRSELVMVNAPHGDYVFYVATKNNQDKRWTADNAAWELARRVSRTLWEYFEPKETWALPEGYRRYLEGLDY